MNEFFFRLLNKLKNSIFSLFWKNKLGAFGKGSTIGRFALISHPKNIFIGRAVQIQQGVVLRPSKNHKIEIGSESGINPYTAIYGKVKIGKWAMIAPHVMIAGGNHVSDGSGRPLIKCGKSSNIGIIIEDNVWIGANSVIVDGVTIGKGSIVAAGSVVIKNVDPYQVVGGNPAKVIRGVNSTFQNE